MYNLKIWQLFTYNNKKEVRIVSTITGERISYLRSERNIERDELAKILGVKKRTIVAYEQGTRDPSTKVLRAMIEYFNVSADYILGYTNKPLRLDTIRNDETKFIILPKTVQESLSKYNSISDYVDFIANKKDD